MHISLEAIISDYKEWQRHTKAVIDAIEQYTEKRMTEYGKIHTDDSRSGGQPVLEPCPFCGEQCADLIIDQGDKWAQYEPSCLRVRTSYNVAADAPWRDEAIAAWNTRQPTQSDAVLEGDATIVYLLGVRLGREDERAKIAAERQADAQSDALREALEAAPLIGHTESAHDFMKRQNAWLNGPYRAALQEQSK